MAFRRERGRTLVLDLSDVRPAGSADHGDAGTAGIGAAVAAARVPQHPRHVIEPARARDLGGEAMQPWEQALLVDHYLSVEVQVGGARRAARMATKSWRDPGVLRFIRAKTEGGLWTANHSVMVDRRRSGTGARRGDGADPLTAACPRGVRRGDALRLDTTASPASSTATCWRTTAPAPRGTSRCTRTGATSAASATRWTPLPGCSRDLARRAGASRFPVTTNPCGEIALHVTGGYCVIADFAPLLACPVPLDDVRTRRARRRTSPRCGTRGWRMRCGLACAS